MLAILLRTAPFSEPSASAQNSHGLVSSFVKSSEPPAALSAVSNSSRVFAVSAAVIQGTQPKTISTASSAANSFFIFFLLYILEFFRIERAFQPSLSCAAALAANIINHDLHQCQYLFCKRLTNSENRCIISGVKCFRTAKRLRFSDAAANRKTDVRKQILKRDNMRNGNCDSAELSDGGTVLF